MTAAQIDRRITALERRKERLERLERISEEVAVLEVRNRTGSLENLQAVRRIVTEVAHEFQLTTTLMLSRCRESHIAWPRMICYWLCRKLTECTTTEIGRMLGNLDHSTVSYGCKSVKWRMETEPEFAVRVNRIMAKCKEAAGEKGETPCE